MKESVKETRILRKHNADEAEVIDIRLAKSKTPIAYARKVKELMDQGCYKTIEEAEKFVDEAIFQMEFYYSIDSGLFLVESEAVENTGPIYNPYTGDALLDEIDE